MTLRYLVAIFFGIAIPCAFVSLAVWVDGADNKLALCVTIALYNAAGAALCALLITYQYATLGRWAAVWCGRRVWANGPPLEHIVLTYVCIGFFTGIVVVAYEPVAFPISSWPAIALIIAPVGAVALGITVGHVLALLQLPAPIPAPVPDTAPDTALPAA